MKKGEYPPPLFTPEEIIEDTSNFLRNTQGNKFAGRILSDVAKECDEEHKGSEVHLIIDYTTTPLDMGKARFNGFSLGPNGNWSAEFTLLPEGVSAPVPVGNFSLPSED